jgi:hypothetical protein
MTDLRKAAEQALEALEKQHNWMVANGGGEMFAIPSKKAINALRTALEQPEQEPLEYKEECWACGCEECICATKVPGYYESKIKEAVLAEREACAKVCEEIKGVKLQGYEFAAAIRARGEK